MLASFAVENFLSIRDRVELNMIAVDHDKSLPGNIITAQLKRTKPRPLRLLKSAVVYGPNASGKTNILRALQKFSFFVATTVHSPGKPIPFVPFALDPKWKNRPSVFEISFIIDGTLYRYGLSAGDSIVYAEYLYATDKAGERKIFERHALANDGEHSFDYGSSGKDLRKIEQFVRSDSLLLAVGASYNNEECKSLWSHIDKIATVSPDLDARKAGLSAAIITEKNVGPLSDIAKYLGFGFSNLSVHYPPGTGRCGEARCGEQPIPDIVFSYTDATGNDVLLDEGTQSDGTIIFLNLLADILAMSKNRGGILYLDEIEASLHPILCEALFKIIHALPGDAIQLICTTHNTQLLNADIFRRDQVWLTEKSKEGATDLYSLADFQGKPRKEARWGKQYLEGRFGGLPVVNTARVEEILSRFTATEAVEG